MMMLADGLKKRELLLSPPSVCVSDDNQIGV